MKTLIYIQNGNKYYKLLSGLGTGNHSGTIIADIIVNYIYQKAINMINKEPKGLSLYVDDSWGIWEGTRDEFKDFLDKLNGIWESINFTIDLGTEDNGDIKLPFLDVCIKITNNGEIDYEFYRKSTASGKYLHYTSHNPLQTKINIIRTEARRRLNNCKYICNAYKHLNDLKSDLLNSGYPNQMIDQYIVSEISNWITPKNNSPQVKPTYDFILKIPYVTELYTRVMKKHIKDLKINARVVVASGFKLISTLKSQHPNKGECDCLVCHLGIKCHNRNFVYEAKCNECDKMYIGGSSRPAKKRIMEHESALRLDTQTDRSSIAKHNLEAHNKESNNIKEMFKFTMVDKGKDAVDTFIREGLILQKRDQKMHMNEMMENGFVR